MLCHVNDYALHEKHWRWQWICMNDTSLKTSRSPACTKCLTNRKGSGLPCLSVSSAATAGNSLPCLSSGGFSWLNDSAVKDPAASNVSSSSGVIADWHRRKSRPAVSTAFLFSSLPCFSSDVDWCCSRERCCWSFTQTPDKGHEDFSSC